MKYYRECNFVFCLFQKDNMCMMEKVNGYTTEFKVCEDMLFVLGDKETWNFKNLKELGIIKDKKRQKIANNILELCFGDNEKY